MYGLAVPRTPAPDPAGDETRAERRLYIAPYGHEAPCDVEVVFDAEGRVRYADEQPGDRCVDGWLWERWEGTQTGGQRWAEHHPARQPHVMTLPPLCGGCAGEADRDERGMLWLLHPDEHSEKLTFPCDIITATPPMCLPDAHWALRACRAAKGEFIAVRTRAIEIIGVRGTVYSPTQPPLVDELVLFDDSRMHQVVARQTIIKLCDAERDVSTLRMLASCETNRWPCGASPGPHR